VRNNLENWATKLSTPEHEMKSYFIEVSFQQVADPEYQHLLTDLAMPLGKQSDPCGLFLL
jgi:hypothetical protein